MLAAFLLFIAGAALLYALCAIQDFIAEKLKVEVSMANVVKNVGDSITVTVTAVPDGAPITSVSVQADPAVFAPTADPLVFTCLQAAVGVTISAQALAASGATVTGVSDPFDVVVPVVEATGLTVAVA